jgi:hypothetical protein
MLYGLIAYGHIPDKVDQFSYIDDVIDDTVLALDNGQIKLSNKSVVYDPQRHNVFDLSREEPHWAL